MSNYSKTTNFASKDALVSGDVNKIVKGSEIDTEFTNIQTSIATKSDTNAPTFTGTVTAAALTVSGAATLPVATLTNPALTSQTLTDAATVSWDASLGSFATVTVAGSRTLAAPTNLKVGHYVLIVIQDAVGGRTLTWNAVFKGLNGAAMPQPNTAISTVTAFSFECNGTNLYLVSTSKKPTVQVLTSGSGTYTTPTGTTALKIRMIGGGGGGAGSGTAPGAPAAAGDTTFSTLTAGKGGAASTVTGGAGGTGTNGDLNITGGTGGTASTANAMVGGMGGASVFGGAGPQGGAGVATAGAGVTNTGGGGGGASQNATASGGGGGGAGAYVEKIIISPAATYSYAVGVAGGAGSAGGGGFAGAAGGSGIIIVEELYS